MSSAIAFTTDLQRARRLAATLTVGIMLPFASSLASATDEHYVKDSVVLAGIDVVAYHTLGQPTPGSTQYNAEYQGGTWHFANATHRDLFVANPAKYAPAYGGWCTAGASKGKKVATQPQFWKIVDGQLYLNSTESAHTKLFLADPAGVIRKGESNWKVIFATKADKL